MWSTDPTDAPRGEQRSFPDSPTLTLRSRGVSGTRSAETLGFGFRGHPTLNCDEP